MGFIIRNAGVDDAEAVAAVHAASLQAAWRPLIPERVAHLVLDPPEAGPRVPGWRRCLARPRVSTTLVACDGSAVVGFCTLRPVPGRRKRGRHGGDVGPVRAALALAPRRRPSAVRTIVRGGPAAGTGRRGALGAGVQRGRAALLPRAGLSSRQREAGLPGARGRGAARAALPAHDAVGRRAGRVGAAPRTPRRRNAAPGVCAVCRRTARTPSA